MTFHRLRTSVKTRVIVVTSTLWLVSLLLLNLAESVWQFRDLWDLMGKNQFSTVSVVAAQVTQQLEDRISALTSVAEGLQTTEKTTAAELQSTLEQRPVLGVLFNGGSFLTDAAGTATASVPLEAQRLGVNFRSRTSVQTALSLGVPGISEVTLGLTVPVPLFSIAVPVRNSRGEITGSLVGVTDLTGENFLSQISGNKLGRTGGFLLVAPQQRLIVTASDRSRALEKLAGPGVNPKIVLLADLERREEERVRFDQLATRNQKLEALGLLAGGIAHDFNNLLASIFGNIELALMKDPDGPASRHLHKTLTTLDRARHLTRQLLTFSKGGEPDLRPGLLFPFVEETARFALTGSAVLCRVDADPNLWPCRFDRNQLAQVIDNLVINALQAMPAGGTVTLTARNLPPAPGGRFIQLSVGDTGPGLAPEVRDHLFEPFFTTKNLGQGLGLSTCYSIVHKHGGTIEVESEEGRGTTFHLQLPACDEEVPPEVTLAPANHRGTGTILVLDDEKEVGEVLEGFLATFGYQVILTETGDRTVEAFVRDRDRDGPRAIVGVIVDMTVPGGMGGVEVLARIRQVDGQVPVLVASGFSEDPVLANPRAWGFTASLRKPYLRAELDQVLRSW